MMLPRMLRPFGLVAAILLVAGCANDPDTQPLEDLGPFRLSHNIVLAGNAQPGPLSRAAEAEDLQRVMTEEIDRRFRRYEGTRLYHLGVNIDAYVLAIPGIPLVASPNSALIFTVNVWDDALGRRLNENPHRITVLESPSGRTLLGSGLTQDAETQLRNLSINAARAIERWLAANPQWFDYPTDGAVAAEETAATEEAGEQAGETPPPATRALR
jgi:hypothetical protein